MTPADVSFMHTNTHVMSNDRLRATVIFDSHEVFYDVGVRLRGSGYGRNDARTGFNLSSLPTICFAESTRRSRWTAAWSSPPAMARVPFKVYPARALTSC